MNSDLLEGAILSLIELHTIIYTLPYFRPDVIISLLIAFNIEMLKEVQGISEDEFATFEISETIN